MGIGGGGRASRSSRSRMVGISSTPSSNERPKEQQQQQQQRDFPGGRTIAGKFCVWARRRCAAAMAGSGGASRHPCVCSKTRAEFQRRRQGVQARAFRGAPWCIKGGETRGR